MIKTDKIIADKHVDAKGNDMFVSQNGGTMYHTTKWFTTTQSITIAADGLSVTAAGAQFTAGTIQLGAKLIVDGVERIITTPNPTTTVVYVTEVFPLAMRGQTYASAKWGLYPRESWFSGDKKIYGDKLTGNQELAYQQGGNWFGNYFLSGDRSLFTGSSITAIRTFMLKWSDSATTLYSTIDTGLSRNSAGVLEINNGTAGQFRDLILRNIFSAKNRTTEEGGNCVKLTNKTGSNSVKGTIVYASPTTDNAFGINPIDGDMPFGVVYENGVADGSECWVVISGIAEVLMTDGEVATRSYIAYSSGTTAGRISISASVPASTTHFKEIGHTLESKTAGANVLVKCILHFN